MIDFNSSLNSKTRNSSIRGNTEKRSRMSEKSYAKSPNLFFIVFLYLIRILMVGMGVSVLAGTVLSHVDTTKEQLAQSDKSNNSTQEKNLAGKQVYSLPLSTDREIIPLKDKLQALITKYPQFQAGLFLIDLDNGAYVNLHGNSAFSAASVIKIPILVAFFQDVDAKKIKLDEMLTMDEKIISSGSGHLQYQKPGKKFTALEVVTKMITISDNTATNMLIRRLGGAEPLNQRFLQWGLTSTMIRDALPDLDGKNTTSPYDLVNVLSLVNQGDLVSSKSRDRIRDIMKGTVNNSLLPKGLEKGAIIAHKTGDIGSVLGDAGMVDMPNGKRYIAAVMVKRPHNNYVAAKLIQEISAKAYQHFKWYEKPTVEKPD